MPIVYGEGKMCIHMCCHCNRLRNKPGSSSGWRLSVSSWSLTTNSCSAWVLCFFSVLLLMQPHGLGWIPGTCSHTCFSAARSRGPNFLSHEKKLSGTVHYKMLETYFMKWEHRRGNLARKMCLCNWIECCNCHHLVPLAAVSELWEKNNPNRDLQALRAAIITCK